MADLNMEQITKLLNDSSNYWERRSMLTTLGTMRTEEEYANLLKKTYDSMEKKLTKALESTYARYAKNNNISNEEAYKLLTNKEVLQRRMELTDYIKNAKSTLTPELQKTLLNESLKHQVTVMDDLSTQWKIIVEDLNYDGNARDVLNKTYNNAFYRAEHDFSKAGIDKSFNQVDVEKVDKLLREDWGYGSFSENVWKNKAKLNNALEDILTVGFAQGSDLGKMSQQLADRMQVDYKVALRLVRTESVRLQNQGTLDSYKAMGLEKFQYIATLDSVTSDICRHMDMEIFNLSDAKIGLNVPPLHPNCRSAIMPYFEDDPIKERVMLDPMTNKNITTDVRDYEEYLDKVLGKSDTGFVSERQKLKQLTGAEDTKYNTTPDLWNSVVDSLIQTTPTKLTKTQKTSMVDFVDNQMDDINDLLEDGGVLSKEQKALMKKIDNALLKLEAEVGLVSRDVPVLPANVSAFLEDYTPGNIVSFNSYLDVTTLQHNPGVSVQFLIQSKSGRKLDTVGKEGEILFSRNAKFHVLYVDASNVNNILIVMEELL